MYDSRDFAIDRVGWYTVSCYTLYACVRVSSCRPVSVHVLHVRVYGLCTLLVICAWPLDAAAEDAVGARSQSLVRRDGPMQRLLGRAVAMDVAEKLGR